MIRAEPRINSLGSWIFALIGILPALIFTIACVIDAHRVDAFMMDASTLNPGSKLVIGVVGQIVWFGLTIVFGWVFYPYCTPFVLAPGKKRDGIPT
jgi:hypothetical protein